MDIYDTYSNPYHHLKETADTDGKRVQYYLHDAGGNILCIYEVKDDRLYLKEHIIYGSNRLGVLQLDQLLPVDLREGGDAVLASSERYVPFMGQRRYELPDHLGNVHVTVSNRKQEKGVVAEQMLYIPEMLSSTDYYHPFGYPMPNRGETSEPYRYGFNGQEKDDEVYGEGASYTAEFWQYDSRLGRRWNVDPIQHPSLSSYSAFSGNPILYSDPMGLDTIYRSTSGTEWSRYPGKGDALIIEIDEAVVNAEYNRASTNGGINPYAPGLRPFRTFENNRNNPNLWLNRSPFSWAGSGQSEWMRNLILVPNCNLIQTLSHLHKYLDLTYFLKAHSQPIITLILGP